LCCCCFCNTQQQHLCNNTLPSACSCSATTTTLPLTPKSNQSSGKCRAQRGHYRMKESEKVGAKLEHAHARHGLALRTPAMSQNTQKMLATRNLSY